MLGIFLKQSFFGVLYVDSHEWNTHHSVYIVWSILFIYKDVICNVAKFGKVWFVQSIFPWIWMNAIYSTFQNEQNKYILWSV